MNEILWSPHAEDAYLAILETTYFFSTAAALDLDERTDKLLAGSEGTSTFARLRHLCLV